MIRTHSLSTTARGIIVYCTRTSLGINYYHVVDTSNGMIIMSLKGHSLDRVFPVLAYYETILNFRNVKT